MESEIIKAAVSQGFFALLFVFLLVYLLRETERRETRMEATQKELMGALSKLGDSQQALAGAQDRLVDAQEKLQLQHERLAGDVRDLTVCVRQLCDLRMPVK